MKKSSIDFSELDFREVGSWPLPLRVPIIIVACLVSILLVYLTLISAQLDELDAADKQEMVKRREFSEKYNMAENLVAYEKQTEEMSASYKFLLKQLPSDSNIPDLIESMSKIADKDNLKFQSIQLGDPTSESGFYKQLPIVITLLGTYHALGKFISDISSLPRIVTLHDFEIKRSNNQNDPPGTLVMTITARTYWLSAESPTDKGGTAGKAAASPVSGPAGAPMPVAPGAAPPGKPAGVKEAS